MQIVGTEPNPDLPLYAQLFVVREINSFRQFYYNQLWAPALAANIGLNFAMFVFQRKFMLNAQANLISVKRILGCFFASFFALDPIAKHLFADKYYVDINSLLD